MPVIRWRRLDELGRHVADALLNATPRSYGRQLISVSDRNCETVSHSQPPGRGLDEMSTSASQQASAWQPVGGALGIGTTGNGLLSDRIRQGASEPEIDVMVPSQDQQGTVLS
jgi:hypothetical protein